MFFALLPFPGRRRRVDNTKGIKPEAGTIAGVRVESCGGLLPLPQAIFAHFMVSAGLTDSSAWSGILTFVAFVAPVQDGGYGRS